MKPKSAKYLARASAFAEAVDLAVAIRSAPPWEDRRAVAHYLWCKERTIPPYRDPVNANLRGLAQLENIFFTEWNEGSGGDVERFWQLVAERGLPFERKDIVRDVLKRGRINNEMKYQTITDSIVIQEQMGEISAAEAERLAKMLGQFEERASKRRSR
jgi:hypothetical protein